ncbi:hypothetical protein HDU85_005783 [Gaertneriomyces sp. JEL0708]|nr:hypothetical protein HDU85_005783 [Gaertneriomyces sp. JEL0708]
MAPSASGIDPVRQRQIALGVYLLTWAIKFRNVAAYLEGDTVMGSQELQLWFLLDLLFFFGLWKTQTPGLDFRFTVFGVIVFAHWMFDMGGWGFLAPETHHVGGVDHAGDVVNPAPAIFDDAYIQGSHLVNVKPPTVVKLNPEAQSFCLGFGNKTTVLPVKIKGTPPWDITYEFYGYDGSFKQYKNITLDQSSSITGKKNEKNERVVDTYGIEVERLGVYRLAYVYEGKEAAHLLKPDMITVVPCPDARLVPPKGDKQVEAVDICVDQPYTFNIHASGTPPLKTWYLRKVGKTESLVVVEGLDGEPTIHQKKSLFGTDPPEDVQTRLDATRPRRYQLPVEFNVEAPSEHLFKVVQVTDGDNNTVTYPSRFLHDMPPTHKTSLLADRFSESFLLNGRALPQARFENCENVKVRTGYEDETATLPIHLAGTGPWDIRYARAASQEDAAAGVYEFKGDINDITTSRLPLSVRTPGVYVLLSVAGKYCPGTVELPTTCVVQKTVPPTIDVSVEPIVKDCFGATGLHANLSMTGEPPFWIEYEQINKNTGHKSVERRNFNKAVETMDFKPSLPGEYEYIFTRIGDGVYEKGVAVSGKRFTQVIHAPPEVTVVHSDRMRCLGDTARISVDIGGVAPWTLSYELYKGSQKDRYVQKDISNRRFDIETPAFQSAGTYFVELVEVTDGNGCTERIKNRPISIEVLSQRPSVHFQCPRPIQFLEGQKATLPVGISGHGKYKLTYRRGDDNKEFSVSGERTISGIEVSQAGDYELVGITDAYCSGRVLSPSACRAVTIPRPSVSLSETDYLNISGGVYRRQPVCAGTPDVLEAQLTGRPPFKIIYKHEWTGRVSKEQEAGDYEDHAAHKFARINLATDKPGLHKYRFTTIADDNYRTPMRINDGAGLLVEQVVNPRPKAVFLEEPERLVQCVSSESDTELKIQLTGQPPFRLQMFRKHESQLREIINLEINENTFTYRPEEPTSTGTFKYTIQSVADASGCETIYDGTEEGSWVKVTVADIPRISLDHHDRLVCVGDMLVYSLEGTAPFTVGYDWNGLQQKPVTVNDPVLMLFPGESGVVNITRVCNANKCCWQPPAGILKDVKPLPRAKVDGGLNVIDDIREGEESTMLVELNGTPPFSFRYTRKPNPDAKRKKQEPPETFTIENINVREYELHTDKEGLFRVTWVKDAYCEYPPKKMADPKMANALLKKKK